MIARSAECRQQSPSNEEDINRKAANLWNLEKRKALVDIFDIEDNEFKQKVIKYANKKYGDIK